ncbi:Oidioi.mRNA.OKI2018_I69.PAR.g12850.t1.cds [Oikopleura dioica]|uniref:Kinase n=1 Tax=Oikopleura dioica TaxID=34765 RepID=A0ABN7S862_OIKDI|nr:Oidioi.mRNA.OKI2018_I69.PAR.g12850.t1.cds [Oikopleura dioica]
MENVLKRDRKRTYAKQEDDHDEKGVLLKRFAHQVAGRNPMYCIDSTTICKPLNPREAQFYNSRGFVKRLEKFAPRFRGRLVARVNDQGQILAISNDNAPSLSCHRLPLKHRVRHKSDNSTSDGDSSEGDENDNTLSANSWSERIHKEKRCLSHRKFEVILLENVTANCQKPVVLDVKVGTRLWYPLDTEKKISNHVIKAKNTTTESLGLRLHGLQIYHPEEDKFEHWDKHWGRSLSSASFEKAVFTFIDSSHPRLRYPIASALHQHLVLLRRCVESLESYRFPGCSLLLIFDGAAWERLDECNVDEDKVEELTRWLRMDNLVSIKMVDFAKATYSGFLHDKIHVGPDQGYLYGLNNLLNIIQTYLDSTTHSNQKF